MKKQYLEVGKIVGTHGVRGMVRIQPWCDSFDFLKGFKIFYLDAAGKKILKCTRIAQNGNIAIAAFEGIESIENAEKLRNRIIYINRDDAALEDAHFIQDIIGCEVIDANSGEAIGTVGDVSQTGANDVWHIKNGEKEYLIPVIDDVVKEIDIDAGIIKIIPLKGLFNDED